MKVIISSFYDTLYPIGIGDDKRMVFLTIDDAKELNEKLKKKISEYEEQRKFLEDSNC